LEKREWTFSREYSRTTQKKQFNYSLLTLLPKRSGNIFFLQSIIRHVLKRQSQKESSFYLTVR
jgi:hypothetical protein